MWQIIEHYGLGILEIVGIVSVYAMVVSHICDGIVKAYVAGYMAGLCG